MSHSESLLNLKVPWGQQTIELHETHFEGTSVKLLRVRIREGKRFTIFDIDSVTARAWGEAMSGWADRQDALAALTPNVRPSTGTPADDDVSTGSQ